MEFTTPTPVARNSCLTACGYARLGHSVLVCKNVVYIFSAFSKPVLLPLFGNTWYVCSKQHRTITVNNLLSRLLLKKHWNKTNYQECFILNVSGWLRTQRLAFLYTKVMAVQLPPGKPQQHFWFSLLIDKKQNISGKWDWGGGEERLFTHKNFLTKRFPVSSP